MNKHGEPIWYELMTSDIVAAAPFYEAVLGWTHQVFDHATGGYYVFSANGEGIGGGMTLPDQAKAHGARPGWILYVGVDDVDASARDIVAAGGTQHMAPSDIEGVGRLAMLADPQGVVFYVMRGASPEDSGAFSQSKPGHVAWNELYTSDLDAALAFYEGRFGWTNSRSMPMGEMGDYKLIAHDGREIGGAMKAPPGVPVSWGVYFNVEDIDRTAEAIQDNGGTIRHGPVQVPGGAYTISAADPQGAAVGFTGPRKG